MKEVISTKKAPEAVGPYSQAIRAEGFVFISGMLPLDPKSGQLVAGSIKEQTRRVLDNLRGVLEEADSSLEEVVKTTIYLSDLADFPEANEIYAEYFRAPYPARATVGVRGLPKGVSVEIEAVALSGRVK